MINMAPRPRTFDLPNVTDTLPAGPYAVTFSPTKGAELTISHADYRDAVAHHNALVGDLEADRLDTFGTGVIIVTGADDTVICATGYRLR